MLDVIQHGEERVSRADVAEPYLGLDGSRQESDVLRRQRFHVHVRDNLRGIEGALTEAIIDDVAPDLQDEQSADLRLIQSAATEEVEVVEVPQLSPSAPCGELLGERLLQRRRRNPGGVNS